MQPPSLTSTQPETRVLEDAQKLGPEVPALQRPLSINSLSVRCARRVMDERRHLIAADFEQTP